MRYLFRLIVFLAATVSVTACGDDSPPKSLEAVSKNVVQISNDGGRVVIVLRSQGYDGGESDMTRVALDLQELAEWQMTHGEGAPAGLSIVVRIPTRDKYGNEGAIDGVRLDLSGDDLGKVNWGNISHWDLMNLSTPHFEHPVGRHMFATWCVDDQNLKYSRPFCRKVSQS